MSISVILPAYKEEENLIELLPKIHKALLKIEVPYEILIIDTMDRLDNTWEVCEQNGCSYIQRHGGNDYGDAIRTGIQYAQMPYLVFMDADGSHNPEDIATFYKVMKESEYNVVIGSRYIKGGNSSNGIILKAMSYMVNLVYRLIFHLKAKDVSNSFRMYHTEQLRGISLECENFDIVEEILIRLSIKYKNFSLKEVPVYFDKRMYGKTKRNLWRFVLSYLSTILRMYRIRKKAIKEQRS